MRNLLVALLPILAPAESFHIGEELHHVLTVCVSKESATAIVKADEKDGLDAARKAYAAADDCDEFPVGNGAVGKVVYSAKVKRGEEQKTVSVAEIVLEGKVVAYFITSKPVLARLEVIPKGSTKS